MRGLQLPAVLCLIWRWLVIFPHCEHQCLWWHTAFSPRSHWSSHMGCSAMRACVTEVPSRIISCAIFTTFLLEWDHVLHSVKFPKVVLQWGYVKAVLQLSSSKMALYTIITKVLSHMASSTMRSCSIITKISSCMGCFTMRFFATIT